MREPKQNDIQGSWYVYKSQDKSSDIHFFEKVSAKNFRILSIGDLGFELDVDHISKLTLFFEREHPFFIANLERAENVTFAYDLEYDPEYDPDLDVHGHFKVKLKYENPRVTRQAFHFFGKSFPQKFHDFFLAI